MTGPEHYRRAEELAAEAHRLLGQADGQATAVSGAPLPRPLRCLPWPPLPRSAHPVRITAPGPTPPGPGSDPAAVIIDPE
jgi:hypothetical protein